MLTCLSEVSKDDLNRLGLFGSMLGHIGDGNFHETILFDGEKEHEMVTECVHAMVYRALEMDGTCTVSLRIHISDKTAKLTESTGRAWGRPWKKGVFGGRSWQGIAASYENHQGCIGSTLDHESGENSRPIDTVMD